VPGAQKGPSLGLYRFGSSRRSRLRPLLYPKGSVKRLLLPLVTFGLRDPGLFLFRLPDLYRDSSFLSFVAAKASVVLGQPFLRTFSFSREVLPLVSPVLGSPLDLSVLNGPRPFRPLFFFQERPPSFPMPSFFLSYHSWKEPGHRSYDFVRAPPFTSRLVRSRSHFR